MADVLNNVPLPIGDRIALGRRSNYRRDEQDPQEGLVGDTWREYFTALTQTVSQGPQRVAADRLTDQAATIAATDISGGGLSAGMYRLTYYMAVTQAAGVSSSLTVTLSWTDSGIPKSQAFAAVTGNTTATIQSGTIAVEVDGSSPIRYAVAYASVGAPVMKYKISVALEQIQV